MIKKRILQVRAPGESKVESMNRETRGGGGFGQKTQSRTIYKTKYAIENQKNF